MSIWDFQKRLSATLSGWAASSMGSGALMIALGDEYLKGMGEQFAGWGAVNMAIAQFGNRSAARRRTEPDAYTPAVMDEERRKLSRLLWINAGLDVVYVLGGLYMASTRGATDERWRGRGWGIVAQGGFLLAFDVVQALALAGENEEPETEKPAFMDAG